MDAPDDPLVAELRDLGRHLDVPPSPDLRSAVRGRIAGARSARAGSRPSRRGWLAVVVALVVGVVAVVPPARAAVVDVVNGVLRFAGVEVRREPGPYPLPVSPSPLPSIRSAALDEARRVARFPVRVPAVLGVPEEVTVADPAPDGAPRVVMLAWRGGAVRLDEFDGRLDFGFVKTAGNLQWTTVDGRDALWFPGPHAVAYVDRSGAEQVATARLAGPTLIWEVGGVTYRLEGVPQDEAVRIAESLT